VRVETGIEGAIVVNGGFAVGVVGVVSGLGIGCQFKIA